MKLYHYTTREYAEQIHKDGLVIPGKLGITPGLSWFTDLDSPIREALGLTSNFIKADRTEARVIAFDGTNIRPWITIRRMVEPWIRQGLESAPGAMPMHWYVSNVPVPARIDINYGSGF